VVILSTMLWLIAGIGGQAKAAPSGLLVCNATGTVVVVAQTPGPFADQWTVAVKGSCIDTSLGVFVVEASGVGTSDSLGLCDGIGFVQNLHLNMTITLTSVADSSVTVSTESWEGPITTYPIVTPFLVEDGGIQSDNDVVGAGAIFSHVFAQCPPLGTPVARIDWARAV
jgi:hypothetical protein